jgi:hypothetical protein
MANVTRMPNRSPGVNTTMATRGTVKSFGSKPDSSYKGLLRTLDSARKPSNQNVRPKLSVTDPEFSSKPSNANKPLSDAKIKAQNAARTKDIIAKARANTYGPLKPAASSVGSTAGKIAGGIARGAMRAAGPAGALASMTTPAGTGSDKPKGPLMTGNSKGKGPGGGSLSAPNRTAPSRPGKISVTGGRGVTAFGGSSGQAPKVAGGKGDLNSPYRTASGVPARTTPSRSGGASNSKGPAGPLGPNSGPSRSGGASNSKGPAGPSGPNSGPSRSTGASASRGPSSGPTSAPSRTAPSKANLGTSRF